jgi:2-polyprenyl-3-methyl-5-hydroxy-6-metoxy-1,4-benzoquinol methylase
MVPGDALPESFLQELSALESSYLTTKDPIRQSGFGGGAARWRSEREPILEAIDRDGDLLDVGCANGYLLECLMTWGRERGMNITPHGLDYGAGLIQLARRRLPEFASNFEVGNAWDWTPPRRYDFVYTLHDCVPRDYLRQYLHRLVGRMVTPGGRLILGAYGSRSQKLAPFDVRGFMISQGLPVVGWTTGGNPPISLFAWIDTSTLAAAPEALSSDGAEP